MARSSNTVGARNRRASHSGVNAEEQGEGRDLCGAARREGVGCSRPMRNRELLWVALCKKQPLWPSCLACLKLPSEAVSLSQRQKYGGGCKSGREILPCPTSSANSGCSKPDSMSHTLLFCLAAYSVFFFRSPETVRSVPETAKYKIKRWGWRLGARYRTGAVRLKLDSLSNAQ